MRAALASVCAGVAAWCSLGTIGFLSAASAVSRVALLPPWWWLPALIVLFFVASRMMRLSGEQASPLFGSAVLLLPWLPVPLPAAAFLWTGPLSALVWMLVLGAVVHARWPPRTSRWLTEASRAPVLAGCLALLLYGLSAWWLAPVLPDGDSPHYLILAQSLIEDGDIQIENNHRRGDYLSYSLQAAQPDYLRRGVNGQIYSIHAPGLPLVIAPAMWLFGYPGAVAFHGILAAASTALVWWLAYRLTDSWSAAWFAWACVSLTAPFFFQATEIFPDGLAAILLLVGTCPLWLTERDERAGLERRVGTSVWWIAGASLALLPWLQTRLASLAAIAACLLLLRMRSRREFLAFAALPMVSAVGWFAFFWGIYGTPNPMAPYGTFTQTSVSNLTHGLPGVLFDQQFGLLPNAPVWGVVLAGCVLAALRLRRWALELLALAVPYTISVAMYQHWWGGASAPGRLFTPLTLIIALGAARLWAGSRSATRVCFAIVLGCSVGLAVMLCIPDEGRLLINFRDGIALWAEWAQDVVALSRALPSLFVDTPAHALLKAVIWIATALAAWGGVLVFGQRPRVSWPAIWMLATVPMVAVTIVWRIDRISPITTARSEIGLLRRLSSASAGRWAFDYGQRRVVAAESLRARLTVRSDGERPRSSPSHVLSARAVPPGTYRVQFDARPSAERTGTLTLRLGDTSQPFLTTVVARGEQDDGSASFTLPVAVRSLVVDANGAALRSVSSARLQPVASPVSFEPVAGSARRAVRYATADVFFLDDNAYPEPTGMWIAGGRLARTVIAHDGPRLTLLLRNAPVENVVTIDVDGNRQDVTLAPREERELTIDRRQSGPYSTLRVTARTGFRPSQVEPGNKDLRYLGCWLEPR